MSHTKKESKTIEKPFIDMTIHTVDYTAPYNTPLLTAESLLFDGGRKKMSLGGQWHYAIDQYDSCLRNGGSVR